MRGRLTERLRRAELRMVRTATIRVLLRGVVVRLRVMRRRLLMRGLSWMVVVAPRRRPDRRWSLRVGRRCRRRLALLTRRRRFWFLVLLFSASPAAH